MHRYSTNYSQCLQQLSLVAGAVVGVCLNLPEHPKLGTERLTTSRLALVVTVALFISAVYH